MFRNVSPYFSFKLEFEDYEAVDNCGPSIFVLEPHGVLPISLFWGTLTVMKKQQVSISIKYQKYVKILCI